MNVSHRQLIAGVLAAAVIAVGCASSTPKASPTTSSTVAGGGVTTAGISAARCAANRAAGKITYLSGFDFSASASILDVVVAKDQGYFSKMCLDVDLKPSFSVTNYPLVASGKAQFASAGNFTEILNFSKSGARFVAVADFGKSAIEALLVRDDGKITRLTDLKGKTIGVKGDLPSSIVAMLAKAGLRRGFDYSERLLDGFDPRQHLQQAIDALPVFKSNEPGQLASAGIKFKLFDPLDSGTPGSFGLLYTSPAFLAAHPTAAQDFIRACLKGYAYADAHPAEAVAMSVKAIKSAGNQSFLTVAGETFRWESEDAIVKRSTPAGEPVGLVDGARFAAEVAAYAAAGVFKNGTPSAEGSYDESVARALFDTTGKLIWPTS